MAKSQSALGRGIGAILPDAKEILAQPQNSSGTTGMSLISISQIETNPFQPRATFEKSALTELSESIKIHGVIQPITVRRLNHNTFQLISGERRMRASQLAGLSEIPAYVLETDDQGMMEMALIENIQREDLNSIEIAISYKRLIEECNLVLEELANRVGKERSTVNNYIRLLKLPPEIQLAIRDKKISMGHARAIINVEHIDDQLFIFNQIITKELSVRQVEEWVRNSGKSSSKSSDKGAVPQVYNQLQDQLSGILEAKVAIKVNAKGKGSISIPFANTAHLNKILDYFKK
jgi:ParB family chromosome partitioning protein